MGQNPSVAERASDLVEWQHRDDHFKVFSHRLGQLWDFKDSMKSEDIDTRMGNTISVGEDNHLRAQEDPRTEQQGTRSLKGYVSLKKKRLIRESFNLDLAYITTRVIAMGFPAKGYQSAFRNSRQDVISFLDTYHPTHHKIYNLCSEPDRYYSIKDFPNTRVGMYPIKDHYPANVFLTFVFCLDAYFYMREHSENVIAVHCKAGKGRTGMMIACFLLFSGVCSSANQAIQYYGRRRSYDWVGVSIPSQIRSVEQFESFLIQEFGPDFRKRCDYMVQRYDVISQRLRARMEKPFRLLALWLKSPETIRPFQRRAKVSIRFQDSEKDFTVDFQPQLTPVGVFFQPVGDVVVSGDFCILFKKTFLKFTLWINPTFFNSQLQPQQAELLGVPAKETVCQQFDFFQRRAALEQVQESQFVLDLPRKCKSDFDKYESKFPPELLKGMSLIVVCSKVLRNS